MQNHQTGNPKGLEDRYQIIVFLDLFQCFQRERRPRHWRLPFFGSGSGGVGTRCRRRRLSRRSGTKIVLIQLFSCLIGRNIHDFQRTCSLWRLPLFFRCRLFLVVRLEAFEKVN